jgi:MFS family permease
VILLALSSRMGALSARIGPRVPMTVGPLVAAGGVAWMTTIGPGSSYWVQVLPPVCVFGLGLALTVAPLTATVLAAAPDRHSGLASGVNNAVARVAGMLAVAVLPLIAGLSGDAYSNPELLAPAYETAMWVCSGLLAIGGLLSVVFVRSPSRVGTPTMPTPFESQPHWYCAVDGTPMSECPHGRALTPATGETVE